MDERDLSKFIAYVLRHNPSAVDVTLDGHGFADVDALLLGINETERHIDFDTLSRIVETDSKGRYTFNADKTKIRANQGHSFPVDLQMDERTPPAALYHGTAEKYMDGIRKFGLIKKTRNFVHLSADAQTAEKVGARHGKAVILEIAAKQMAGDGYKFYLSSNGVWQTDCVPYKYIKEL